MFDLNLFAIIWIACNKLKITGDDTLKGSAQGGAENVLYIIISWFQI